MGNALLNHYFQIAKDSHIRIEQHISLPDRLYIDIIDLCSVLGNVLENAITACQDVPEDERFVTITVSREQGTELYIAVSNSFSGKVNRKGKHYLSTKQGGNGIGLSSVSSIAEKYGGLARFYHEGKEFNADVVACERYYNIPEQFWYNTEFRNRLKPFTYRRGKFADKPTFLTNNILERLNLCNRRYFLWNLWSKLIRRDLIFKNEFNFSGTIIDDMVFTICLLCTAERFLLVPNIVNYYRVREDSISSIKLPHEKFFRKYVKAFAAAFRYMNKFLNGRDAFRDNSYLKYIIFEILWSELFNTYFFQLYEQGGAHRFDKILMEELSDGDNLALASFSFNIGIFYRYHLTKLQERIAELEKTAREDKACISELENFIANRL